MIEYFNITTERARHSRARYALPGEQSMLAPDERRVDVTTNYRTTTVPMPSRPNSLNQFGPVFGALFREHNVEILPGGRYKVSVTGPPAGPFDPEDPIEYPPTWDNPGPLRLYIEDEVYHLGFVNLVEIDTTITWLWHTEIDGIDYVVYVLFDSSTGFLGIQVIVHEEGGVSWTWEDIASFANPWVVDTPEGLHISWFNIRQPYPYDPSYPDRVRVEMGVEVDWA